MNIKRFCLIIIYMLIGVICLCGCNENEQDNKLEEKIDSEIDYLDKKIIGVMNKLNNITLENYEVKSKKVSSQSNQKNSSGGSGSSESGLTEGGSSGSNSNESNSGESDSSGEESNSSNKEGSGGQESESNQESNNIKVLQMQPSNILVIDKNDIDWATIKSEIEIMYSSWNTILLDLYKLNIKNEDILNFSQAIDNTIITAKSEDKQGTLANLANLYSYLPKYIEKLQVEESKKNILKTKFNILSAYALVEQDKWEEIQNQLNQADENYTKVTSDVKYIEDKQEQVSRVYVLIKELKNSISIHDKDIFYIKYKNLLNSI